jgi:hypothetical protein
MEAALNTQTQTIPFQPALILAPGARDIALRYVLVTSLVDPVAREVVPHSAADIDASFHPHEVAALLLGRVVARGGLTFVDLVAHHDAARFTPANKDARP